MDEIFSIADTVEVMRDGRMVGIHSMKEITREQIIQMMVGREVSDMYPKIAIEPGEVAMEVCGLCNGSIHDISFNVRKGEIVGLFGLMGAGRTSIMESIFGARRLDSGEIRIKGQAVHIKSPMDAMRYHLAYLPSERKLDGLLLDHSVAENIVLASIERRLGVLKLNLKR